MFMISIMKTSILILVAAMMVMNARAATYTVGDTLRWKVPPNSDTFSDWASTISFEVGDILVFNFPTGQHDVTVVTKEDYDACNAATAIDALATGPATYSLDAPGDYYFFCSVGSHCQQGQKLAISVTSASPGPASNSPNASPILPGTNTGSNTPSPQGSSTASSVSTALLVFLLSFAIAV